MDFSPSSILLTVFTGLVAGLSSYFGAYIKIKAEVRAATESLRQTIANEAEKTRAVELEKAKVAASAARESDRWKTVYALAIATQSLVHSMCWLSWDATTRSTVRSEMAKLYDDEAHKYLPEILGQLAVLYILDPDLHSRAYPYASRLMEIDVEFGSAIFLAEQNEPASVETFRGLLAKSVALHFELDSLFGGKLQANISPKTLRATVASGDGARNKVS